ncbi:MAG: thermonuclease family protein [SAR324 cluster bacterium]|nr:thermonuclease family protein [SAR324 cluster bacterium]
MKDLNITTERLKPAFAFFARLIVCLAGLGFCVNPLLLPPHILAAEKQALPKNWQQLPLKKMRLQVIDGDTFDADLNRNGRFSNPQERIRLLYVDTPELTKSHKGKNPKFGLPAKAFLKTVLAKTRIVLWVDPQNKRGNYERLLGVLEVKGKNVNLALIKRGHSYFNTRYAWPDDFKKYALAEAFAFEKKLGIWSHRKSRKHYLLRLRDEGKTVYSTRNPYFVVKMQKAEEIDLSKYNGRFVRVRGKVKKIQQLRKGAQLIFLKHRRMKKGLPVISFENQRNWLGLEKLRKGDQLQIEGFATLYKQKQWQIRLHRAVLLD